MTESTSLVMRGCLIIGIAITAIGLLLSETETGGTIMWIGLLILIVSPLIGVFTTYVGLVVSKDWYWVKIATILIVVIVIGLMLSIL